MDKGKAVSIMMNWEDPYFYHLWCLVAFLIGLIWYKKFNRTTELKNPKIGEEDCVRRGVVPKGNSCWPLIGETLEFIASGYSSCPVNFMLKRKAL